MIPIYMELGDTLIPTQLKTILLRGICGFRAMTRAEIRKLQYPKSIPFSQFMLQNLLAEQFSDPNENLINAIMDRNVSGYFRDRVQQIADGFDFQVPDAVNETLPVRYSVVVSLQLNTAKEQG